MILDDSTDLLGPLFAKLDDLCQLSHSGLLCEELGTVLSVKDGVASICGLQSLGLEDLVQFKNGGLGIAFNLDAESAGIVLLDSSQEIGAGEPVRALGKPLRVPVGRALLGRVLDGAGRPLDAKGDLTVSITREVESTAPPIMDRAAVTAPLQTGIKVVDALVPLGRGQRELILGERQTGKTSLALDTILNQVEAGVACIYCAIGQRDSAVTRAIAELEGAGALENTCLVVARAEDPPGLQYLAPYTATAIAEHFMHKGQDALIVYDDLTAHAVAYRELSLLLRRPPGREAFPGDVFYLHSRLLERATHLRPELGGGSLTALPICSLESDSLSSYIPTNLISITDGQLVLSARLFQKSLMPAVDVGRSVSRVGGHAQLPAYREFVADLRLEYTQFEELEAFSRLDTRLSPQTRAILERGRRIRAILCQDRHALLSATEQIVVISSVMSGMLDKLSLELLPAWESMTLSLLTAHGEDLVETVESGKALSEEQEQSMKDLAQRALQEVVEKDA